MSNITRREFLQMAGALAAAAGLSATHVKVFAEGLEKLAAGLPRVLWLQAQSCSGCSVSLLNSDYPSILEILTQTISLVFHQTVSAAQGETVMEILRKLPESSEEYILVVEGSIPADMPEACVIGGRPFEQLLLPLMRRAKYVVGAGSCAAYGGIPAAEGNVTGAVGLPDFMRKHGIPTERFLVNCPSCPCHPDQIVGTLAYLAGRGYPPVNAELLTPTMFYAHSTHDDCPRYHYYNKHIFAKHFGDSEGCLFKLGCLGMLSYTECPRRQWNGGVNWCVRAAAPCIGCSHPLFAKEKRFSMYRKNEQDLGVDSEENRRKGEKA
jgi:hydrogenase small subunit